LIAATLLTLRLQSQARAYLRTGERMPLAASGLRA
jgi:hypothetical protein